MSEASLAIPAPTGFDAANPDYADFVPLLNRDVPMSQIVDMIDDVDAVLAAHREVIAAGTWRQNVLKAVLQARMADVKATKLPHRDFTVEMVTTKKRDVRVDVLRELLELKGDDGEPMIPPAELAKAIRLVTPEPEWKTHLTYLKKLGAYGEKVQAILDRGIIEYDSEPVLQLTRIQHDVTPIAGKPVIATAEVGGAA